MTDRTRSITARELAERYLKQMLDSITRYQNTKDATTAAGLVLLGEIKQAAATTLKEIKDIPNVE